VVGDDDQSIYKFRGANIHNILNFEKQFPDTLVIKLEQNYRSTKNILTAANEVIRNNYERKDKALWTENETGEPIHYCLFDTEYNEADFVVETIAKETKGRQKEYSDFAVLYRTNAQSRIFEERLVRHNIPYKIVGAVNFYARKEIKDMLCYLKTIDNGKDDIAVKRIINVPRRGIGLTTIDRISDYALQNNMSFYEALHHAAQIPGIGRALVKLESFVSLIEILKGNLNRPDYSLEDLMKEIIEATGYVSDLEAEGTTEAEGRIENIDELLNKIISFEGSADEPPTLSEFLEEVALVADIDSLEDSSNVVVLMTLHSAKGLEFPTVFLCGMEDGIFPSHMTIFSDDPTEIEEERRLCYVGITRAKERLFLSGARQRMVHGETHFNKPSCFLKEIPRYLLQQTEGGKPLRSVGKIAPSGDSGIFKDHPLIQKGVGRRVTPTAQPVADGSLSYQVGDTVAHTRFGTGRVAAINKLPSDYEVTVDFEKSGSKKMRASFAKLTKV
jgi:DNA helicase-2/ATP-dependent DNA helicase PcrA